MTCRWLPGALLGVAGAWAAIAAQARGGSPPPAGGKAPDGEPPGIVELWRVEGAGRGTPAVDALTVFAQSRTGELLAIDRRTGDLRWRQRSSPAGVSTGGSSVRRWDRFVIAGDEDLVAFDAATGSPAWRFVPEVGYGPGHYLGAVADGLVFAGSPSGHVYAVEAVSGRERWRAAVTGGVPATAYEPVVSSGVVFAGYTVFSSPPVGGVMAWDAVDGRLRWRRPLEALDGSAHASGWGGGLGTAGGLAFATGRDGTLWALSVIDGSTVWHLPAEATGCRAEPGRPELRPLTVTGHLLVTGSSSGCVAAVDAEARRARWRFADVRLGSTASRLASDGRLVYIPFLSGRLVALDRESGVEWWRLGDRDREFIWAPALAGRRVYLTSSSGYSGYVR